MAKIAEAMMRKETKRGEDILGSMEKFTKAKKGIETERISKAIGEAKKTMPILEYLLDLAATRRMEDKELSEADEKKLNYMYQRYLSMERGEPATDLIDKAKELTNRQLLEEEELYLREGRDLAAAVFKKEYLRRTKEPLLKRLEKIPIIKKILDLF